MKYEMSTDYNALYEHLKAGGWAFGKDRRQPSLAFSWILTFGQIMQTKEQFIEWCEMQGLEWIAPCVTDRSEKPTGSEATEDLQRRAGPEQGEGNAHPKLVVSKEIIDAGQAMYHAAEYNRIQADGRTSLAHACERWRIALSNLGEGMSELTDEEIDLIAETNRTRVEKFDLDSEESEKEAALYESGRVEGIKEGLRIARDKGYLSRSVEEDNCPKTGKPCLDECCRPTSSCNLGGDGVDPNPATRSVEEEPVAMIHNDYDASVRCSNCGDEGGFGMYDDLDWAKHCPGCGRPISEQVDAKGNRTPHPLYRKVDAQ